MKITRISDDSYLLTRFGVLNSALVREREGWTLIDTTISGAQDDLLKAAGQLGATIRRVLLTHAHGDHVGAVDALMGRLPAGTELISNERSLPLLRKPPVKTVRTGEPEGEIKGSLPGIDAEPTQLVKAGDHVGSLLVIETPGHIPGHLSFLDERDGTLFTGDALIGVGELRVSGDAVWYFPLPNMATWDKPLALASARHLLEFEPKRFASGHGSVREGGAGALRQAITHAEQAAG